jgi:hypothetical protein
MVDDEGQRSFSRSFSARLRRKEKVSRGEDVPETLEEEQAAASVPAPDPTAESEEDAALDDNQLLQKYGLSNPEEIEDEAGLEAFMENGLPDRLRQMALRRMWRLNPLFRFADEMVEYGENYTDAATVIEGMTTAYQVGKGYLQKAFDALDDEEGVAEGDGLPLSGEGPATQSAAGTPVKDELKENIGKVAESDAEKAGDDFGEDSTAVPKTLPAEFAVSENVSQASQMLQNESPAEELPQPRPQRMTFRKSPS